MSRWSIATWCLPMVVACHGETLDLGMNDAAGDMTPCPPAGQEASSPVDGGDGNDGGPSLGPLLGTWQGLYVFEHRSTPTRRTVVLHFLGE